MNIKVKVDRGNLGDTERELDNAVVSYGDATAVVEATFTEAEPSPAAARGGMSYSGCTGAFIVQSNGVRGISTANHCTTKPSTYDGATLGTSTPYSGRDVRWTRFTSGTSGATFRYIAGSYRTVTSSGNPVVGAAICKFSISTGNSCDTVAEDNQKVKYEGHPEYSAVFLTAHNNVLPGDSGGPWYYDNKAHGVTSGYYSGTSDVFSGIGSLNLLGLSVVTG